MQTIFSLCGFSFRPPAKKLRGWKPRTGVLHPDERDVTIEPERRRRATSSIASSAKRAPEARHTLAQPVRAGKRKTTKRIPSAGGAPHPLSHPRLNERRRRATRLAQGELTKHEFRIKLHAVFPQQRKKLLLKTHFPVMRFLILYISNYHWHNRRAHAKRRVPLLPRELVTFFVCPPRRIRFDRANRLG